MKNFLKELLYPANIISLIRLIILPFFIHALSKNEFVQGLILFTLMIISDFLDGFIARKANQISNLGKGLDPLVDKICFLVLFYYLFKPSGISLLPLYIMLVRDAVLILLGMGAVYKHQPITGSDIFGKITTSLFGLTGFILFIYLHNSYYSLYVLANTLYYCGTVFLVITLFTYSKTAFYLLRLTFEKKTLD